MLAIDVSIFESRDSIQFYLSKIRKKLHNDTGTCLFYG